MSGVWQSIRRGWQSVGGALVAAKALALNEEGLEIWPQDPDLSRLRNYQTALKQWRGQHQGLWDKSRGPEDGPYLPVNLLQMASKLVARRMVGDAPQVVVSKDVLDALQTAPDADTNAPVRTTAPNAAPQKPAEASAAEPWEDVLQDVAEVSTWMHLVYQQALACSYNGDAVWKAIYDADMDSVRFVAVKPGQYFPEFAIEDHDLLTAVSLRWMLPADDDGKAWLREEYHTPGLIENRLYEVWLNAQGAEAPDQYGIKPVALSKFPPFANLPEMVETGIDVIPIVHIPNEPTVDSEPWGISDYESGESIQRAINSRRTEIANILSKHADPMLALDDAWLDENGNFNRRVSTLLPLAQDEPPPQYITWDGQLTDSREEAKDLEHRFFIAMGMSPESFGLGEGAAESGRAIRLRQMLTTSTVQNKQVVWTPHLQRLFSIATKLWAAHVRREPRLPRPLEPRELEIVWGDGLPRDRFEDIQDAVALKGGAMPVTNERLLRMVFPDWDQEQIDEELEAYNKQAEENMKKMQAPGFGGNTKLAEAGTLKERLEAKKGAAGEQGTPEEPAE